MNAPVVVGLDDFENSQHLVSTAAQEARVREAPLWLVHAYQWIPPVALGMPPAMEAEDAVRDAATTLLDKAAAQVRADHPGLEVQSVPSGGFAPDVLAETAKTASLLVLGGRGRGGFAGQLLGSVVLRTLARAHCPVMVVRGESATPTGRIMIGIDIDAPATGPEVLDFAFGEAARSGAHIYAVHAWEDPGFLYPGLDGRALSEKLAGLDQIRHQHLDEVLRPWAEKHRDVTVSRQTFAGSPATLLVDATRSADLLVIGGRRHGDGQDGMRIGGLAQAVLHHAHCPVVVVPEH